MKIEEWIKSAHPAQVPENGCALQHPFINKRSLVHRHVSDGFCKFCIFVVDNSIPEPWIVLYVKNISIYNEIYYKGYGSMLVALSTFSALEI
jgi:hypothetical protein